MNIESVIQRAYFNRNKKFWNKVYWSIDLHGTIMEHTRTKDINVIPTVYPHVETVLTQLSQRGDTCLILYTSTSRAHLEKVFQSFESKHIHFKYLNENPECLSKDYTDFSKKFYYDILLDDKAGFDPFTDWSTILRMLNEGII